MPSRGHTPLGGPQGTLVFRDDYKKELDLESYWATTYSMEVAKRLQPKEKDLKYGLTFAHHSKDPFKEDICYATTNRQSAVKNIAEKCDMFFVLGSRNSSNSVRLVEVAQQSGCINSQLIHSESLVPFDKIKDCKTIGISSGASAPEILVENFINQIKKKFNVKINEVEIVKENIIFKVPGKLS